MKLLILGAIAAGSLTIALFFLRFWRDTRDRFFLFFAVAFAVEGLNRVALGLVASLDEDVPFVYVVRFLSFALILVAIADKNRKRG
ncbi:MAG: DUF5985 family protein [Acidobacteriota bacterium]